MNKTTILGGGTILLLTVLAWMFIPFPANIIIVGILALVSIIAYFLLQLTDNYRLHEVIPAATLDIGILVFLLSFLDTTSALVIWFGLNFVVTGYILRDYVQNRPSWQERFGRFQYVIGSILIVAGVFWTVIWSTLGYTNYDDDFIRWAETTVSQVTQQDEDWYLVLTTDNQPVRYLATVEYLTHSKMEFAAVWTDDGQYGETVAELKQSGYKNRYSRYSGEITIHPAGSIPLQHGTINLNEVREECFTGNMQLHTTEYEVKFYRKGVYCS